MDVIDIGRLIECVQERSFLWDIKNNHHRDRKARDLAWMEIGDEMFDNWSELSRTEKAEKEKIIREKWISLKRKFGKSVRQGIDNIYADSLYFLRDNFNQNPALKGKKNAAKKKAVKAQNDGQEACDNSSSNSFQNSNGLSNTQPTSLQETIDCSSSDSIQITNKHRNVHPSLSKGTNVCSSSGSIKNTNALKKVQTGSSQGTIKSSSSKSVQNTKRLRKAQPRKLKGTSNNSPSISVQNTNTLRNVQPSLSEEMSENVEASSNEVNAGDRLFLISLLRDYRELDEDDKLDFRIMCLQHIRNARKKKNLQNHESPITSSKRCHSVPLQITLD